MGIRKSRGICFTAYLGPCCLDKLRLCGLERVYLVHRLYISRIRLGPVDWCVGCHPCEGDNLAAPSGLMWLKVNHIRRSRRSRHNDTTRFVWIPSMYRCSLWSLLFSIGKSESAWYVSRVGWCQVNQEGDDPWPQAWSRHGSNWEPPPSASAMPARRRSTEE